MSNLQRLTANLVGKIRREILNGREYLVAPISMIVPGVLNGSKGPLLYPLDEITKNADAWNGIPIVVNHPTDEDDNPVSGRTPKVLEKSGIGTIFNVTANGKLTAEGWFDVEKTKQLSPSTLNKLEKGETEELSTGLFTDNIAVKNKAEFNGKPYTHIARNYRPDHLAILPGKRGACSVEDGCGVNVNEENKEPSDKELKRHLDWDNVENTNWHEETIDLIDNHNRPGDHPGGGGKGGGGKGKKVGGKMSGTERVNSLSDSVSKTLASNSKKKAVSKTDIFKAIDRKGMAGLTQKQRSKAVEATVDKILQKGGNVTGIPLSRIKKNKPTSNLSNKEAIMPLTEELKDQIVDGLIANEGVDCEDCNPWEEDDREILNSLPDEKLMALNAQREMLANAEGDEDEDEEEEEEKKAVPAFMKKKKAVSNQEPVVNQKSKTAQEWLADAPEEVRSAVTNAMAFEKRQKDDLIKKITKNERNSFSKDYLGSRSLEELQGLAALATNGEDQNDNQQQVLIPNYAGISGVTSNLGEDFSGEDQDMIPEPFDWSKGK